MKKLKTIIFFSFINLIFNYVIYLNFSSFNSNNNKNTNKNIINNLLNTNINTEICIGDPKQCNKFLIDINFYAFFIVSKDTKNIKNISNKFNQNLSETFSFNSNESHYYSPYFQYGTESYDLIHLKTIENEEIFMNDTDFLLVNELASYEEIINKFEYFSGNIGLGIFDYNELSCSFKINYGFVYSLKKENIIINNFLFF